MVASRDGVMGDGRMVNEKTGATSYYIYFLFRLDEII